MGNYKINMSSFNRGYWNDSIYRVSRSSNSYSYFHDDFINLSQLEDGSILVPYKKEEKKSVTLKERLVKIKKSLLENHSGAVSIPSNSNIRSFFLAEYRNNYCEDINHNIIIPTDEIKALKLEKKS